MDTEGEELGKRSCLLIEMKKNAEISTVKE